MSAPATPPRPTTSRLVGLLFALPFLAAGVGIIGIGTGTIPFPPDKVHAPPWVIVLCGLVFLCGGLAVVAATFGLEQSVGRVFGLPIVAALLVVLHWVAFGDGERKFTATTSIDGGVVDARPLAESTGRFAFGAYAILLDAALVAGAIVWWRRRRRPG